MMQDAALIASAGLMGLVGAPHCAAMCAAPCAAVAARCGGPGQRGASLRALLLGRALAYAAGGAVVAAGVALFTALGQSAPLLRPLWMVAQLASLGLGLWLLCTGRLPAWLGSQPWASLARLTPLALPTGTAATAATDGTATPHIWATPGAARWRALHWLPAASSARSIPLTPVSGRQAKAFARRAASAPARQAGAVLAGSLWLALPCGLLQSALLLSALANTPLSGAMAMGAFAATSSIGLWLAPALWARGSQRLNSPLWRQRLLRATGAALASASLWALGHGMWQRVVAFCSLG